MRARSERQQLVSPATLESAAPLPDGWYDVYRWLPRMTASTNIAEELTVEVCRRLRSAQQAWLAGKAADVQQRFFVAQVLLEHRGVVFDGLRRSAGRHYARSAESAAPDSRHARTPMVVEAVRSPVAGRRRWAGG